MNVNAHDRDPDARRPLTDAMTWGERQRLWRRVAEKERARFKEERDEARQQLQGAVRAEDYCSGMLAAFEANDPYADDLPSPEELLRDVLTRLRVPS